MTDPDVLEQTVHIAASPETVWSFWTRPERLREWWGRAETAVQPGGAFRVEMEQGPVMAGEFLELDPPHRLLFSFGWEGGAPAGLLPPGSTRVEITLIPDGDGTKLTLRHHGLPPEHATDHDKGWSHFLGLLADVAGAPRGS